MCNLHWEAITHFKIDLSWVFYKGAMLINQSNAIEHVLFSIFKSLAFSTLQPKFWQQYDGFQYCPGWRCRGIAFTNNINLVDPVIMTFLNTTNTDLKTNLSSCAGILLIFSVKEAIWTNFLAARWSLVNLQLPDKIKSSHTLARCKTQLHYSMPYRRLKVEATSTYVLAHGVKTDSHN